MANNSLTGNTGAGTPSLAYGWENAGALKRHHYLYNNAGIDSNWLPGWKILNLKVSKETPVNATVKFRLTGLQAVCGFTHGFPYQALLKNSNGGGFDAFTNNVASCINYGWVRSNNYGGNFWIFNGRNASQSVAVNDSVVLSIELNSGVVIYRQNGTESMRSTYQAGVDFYLIASVRENSAVQDLEISGASGFNINDFAVNFEKEIWIPCQEILEGSQPTKPGSQYTTASGQHSRTNIQVRAIAGTTMDFVYGNGVSSYQFPNEAWYTIPTSPGINFPQIQNNFGVGIKVTGNSTLANITGLRIANPQYATQTSLNLPNSVTQYESRLTSLTELEIWGVATELSGTDSRKVSYNSTVVGFLPRISSLQTLFLDSTCDVNNTNAAFSSGTFRNLTRLTFFDIRGTRDDITKHYPEFCSLRSLKRLEINLQNINYCANTIDSVNGGLLPSTLTNMGAGESIRGMTTLENFRGLYRANRTTTDTGLIVNGNITERQANELIIAQISVKMLYGELTSDNYFTYVHRLNSPGYQLNHALYYVYNRSRFVLTDISLASGSTGSGSTTTAINIGVGFVMLTGYSYKLTIGGVVRDIQSVSGNTVTVTTAFTSAPSSGVSWVITGSVTLGDRIVLTNNSIQLYIARTGTSSDDFNVSRAAHAQNFVAGRLLVISTTDPNTHYNARQLFRMFSVTANTSFSPTILEGLTVNNQTHFRWDITIERPKKSISLTGVTITGSSNTDGSILTVTGGNLSSQIASIAIGDTIAVSIPSLPLVSSSIPSIVISKDTNTLTIQKGNVSDGVTAATNASATVCYEFQSIDLNNNYYGDNFKSSGSRVAQSRNSSNNSSWSITDGNNTNTLILSTTPGLFYDNFSWNAISGLNLG